MTGLQTNLSIPNRIRRWDNSAHTEQAQGFSLLELMFVMVILLVVAAVTYPQAQNIINKIRLRSSAGDLAGLMAQARILAAKGNTTYPVGFTTISGVSAAYVNENPPTGAYSSSEPMVAFPPTVTPASAAPSGGTGQPTAYSLSGDGGTAFDNTHTVAFNSRGLPCDYNTGTSPPTCTTPAAGYFVFYLQSTDGKSWAAAVVTRAGSAQVVTWDGSSWH